MHHQQPLPGVNQRVDIWFDGYEEFYGGRVESVSLPCKFTVILDDNSIWTMDTRKHIFRLSDLPPTPSLSDAAPPSKQSKPTTTPTARKSVKSSNVTTNNTPSRKNVGTLLKTKTRASRRSSTPPDVVELDTDNNIPKEGEDTLHVGKPSDDATPIVENKVLLIDDVDLDIEKLLGIDPDNDRDPPSPPPPPSEPPQEQPEQTIKLLHSPVDTFEAPPVASLSKPNRTIPTSPNHSSSPTPALSSSPLSSTTASAQTRKRRTSGRAIRKNTIGPRSDPRLNSTSSSPNKKTSKVPSSPSSSESMPNIGSSSATTPRRSSSRTLSLQGKQQVKKSQLTTHVQSPVRTKTNDTNDDEMNIISDIRQPDPSAVVVNKSSTVSRTQAQQQRAKTPVVSQQQRKKNTQSSPSSSSDDAGNAITNIVGKKRRLESSKNITTHVAGTKKRRVMVTEAKANTDGEKSNANHTNNIDDGNTLLVSGRRRPSVTFRDEVEVFTTPRYPSSSSASRSPPAKNAGSNKSNKEAVVRRGQQQQVENEEGETGDLGNVVVDGSATVDKVSSEAITAVAVKAALEAAQTVLEPLNERLCNLISEIVTVTRDLANQKKALDIELSNIQHKPSQQPKEQVQQKVGKLEDKTEVLRAIPKSVTVSALQNFQLDISEVIGGGEARLRAHNSLSQQEFGMLHRLIADQGKALGQMNRLLHAAQAFASKQPSQNVNGRVAIGSIEIDDNQDEAEGDSTMTDRTSEDGGRRTDAANGKNINKQQYHRHQLRSSGSSNNNSISELRTASSSS